MKMLKESQGGEKEEEEYVFVHEEIVLCYEETNHASK